MGRVKNTVRVKKVRLKVRIAVSLFFISLSAYSQKKDCPPGWEKNPEKHPECWIGLPVTVKSFEAQSKLNTVLLTWVTASEVNHSHYIVQRSVDALKWADLGSTTGYSLSDNYPKEINYYRLLSVDLDGTVNVYKIVFAPGPAKTYEVFNIYGKYLGEFTSLQDIPKKELLIINRVKTILN